MEKPTHLKFVQIAAGGGANTPVLFALDEAGIVWKYIPAVEGGHHSFWSKLTSYRKQPGGGKG